MWTKIKEFVKKIVNKGEEIIAKHPKTTFFVIVGLGVLLIAKC